MRIKKLHENKITEQNYKTKSLIDWDDLERRLEEAFDEFWHEWYVEFEETYPNGATLRVIDYNDNILLNMKAEYSPKYDELYLSDYVSRETAEEAEDAVTIIERRIRRGNRKLSERKFRLQEDENESHEETFDDFLRKHGSDTIE